MPGNFTLKKVREFTTKNSGCEKLYASATIVTFYWYAPPKEGWKPPRWSGRGRRCPSRAQSTLSAMSCTLESSLAILNTLITWKSKTFSFVYKLKCFPNQCEKKQWTEAEVVSCSPCFDKEDITGFSILQYFSTLCSFARFNLCKNICSQWNEAVAGKMVAGLRS